MTLKQKGMHMLSSLKLNDCHLWIHLNMVAFSSLWQPKGMEMRGFVFFFVCSYYHCWSTCNRKLCICIWACCVLTSLYISLAELAQTNKYLHWTSVRQEVSKHKIKKGSSVCVSVWEIRSCPPQAKWWVSGTFRRSHVPIVLQQETVAITSH